MNRTCLMIVRGVAGSAALATAVPGVMAAQVTITGDRDNTLIEEADGDMSNGAGEHFFAGHTAFFGSRRATIHFDVSSIPPGSIITGVDVALRMSFTISGPTTQSLHRLESDWGEGASDAPKQEGGGAPSQPGDATWVHTFYPDQFWNTPGGDFSPRSSASQSISSIVQFYHWTDGGLIGDVQQWVDQPASNFGWMLIGDETMPFTAKRFDSHQNSSPANWPRVTITYASPCPADFDGTGSVSGLDLAIVLGAWTGATVYPGCPPQVPQDLNHDCKVNGLDLAIVLGAWGPCP